MVSQGKTDHNTNQLYERKVCSFGALGTNKFRYRFYDRANSDSFIDFLKSLEKKYSMVLLFADNVAYHKSKKVKRYLKSTKRSAVIIHFPIYMPELNPIEVQWREIKKNLGNQFFADTVQMKHCIRRLVRTGEVPIVKMY